MMERQYCEFGKETAAGTNMPNPEMAAKMPEHRQPECNEPSNDEIGRDRYRMR